MNYEYEPYEFNPEDFLEKYEVTIREMLANSVNSKIKNTIADLKIEKEDNEKLISEKQNLLREISKLKSDYDKNLAIALKEKELEVHRQLGLGFAVGDTVYYVKSDRTTTKCDKCDGRGKVKTEVLGKIVEVNCPHCSYGNVAHYHYYPQEDVVRSLKFWISKKDNWDKSPGELKENWDIEVWLDKLDSYMRRENLFKKIEKCQVECDKNNKEG